MNRRDFLKRIRDLALVIPVAKVLPKGIEVDKPWVDEVQQETRQDPRVFLGEWLLKAAERTDEVSATSLRWRGPSY